MSILSNVKNFIKTEILGIQETDTKTKNAQKKQNNEAIIHCKTEAPTDKIVIKNKSDKKYNKVSTGMSQKAMEETIENIPTKHFNIRKMIRNGLIEKAAGIKKEDFKKLSPEDKSRVITALKISFAKFEEMKNQGLINKNASPEEAIAEYSKIFVESMKQGAFKNSKEFENAVGDIANDLGKGFDKKNIKEQRQLLKKHRMADERRMQAELNKCKKISSKAERIKAENRIRLRHQFARRGQFLEMSVQKDSKVALNSIILLNSDDMEYGAKTVLATRCDAAEKTRTADMANYAFVKGLVSDFNEMGTPVKSNVLENSTKAFMEQKSAMGVNAFQSDYKHDRDNYEAALAKQKRGEPLSAEEKELLRTMKSEYYTAAARGIGRGALNNVNMSDDEKAKFLHSWDKDAQKYDDYEQVTVNVKKELESNKEYANIKEKIEQIKKEDDNRETTKLKNIEKNKKLDNKQETKSENHLKSETQIITANKNFANKNADNSEIKNVKQNTNTSKPNKPNNTITNIAKSTKNIVTSIVINDIKEKGLQKTLQEHGRDTVKVIISNPSLKHLRTSIVPELRSYDLQTLLEITTPCKDSDFVFVCSVVKKEYIPKLLENRKHTKGLCLNSEQQIKQMKENDENVKRYNV